MTTAKGWHIANWGTLGWAETIVKLIGIVAGILAFFATSSASPLVIDGNPELGAVLVTAVLTLTTVGALFARIMQKEIVSLVYAILNLVGHAGLLIALLRVGDVRIYALVFAIAFVIGALIQQQYFRTTGYTEWGLTSPQMLLFSRVGLMLPYVLLAVFILI